VSKNISYGPIISQTPLFPIGNIESWTQYGIENIILLFSTVLDCLTAIHAQCF